MRRGTGSNRLCRPTRSADDGGPTTAAPSRPRVEVPHHLALTGPARRTGLVPDRSQTAGQVGRRRHPGTDARRRPRGSGRRRRHRVDRVGRLHRRPGPPARRRSTQKGAAGHSEPAYHALGRSRGGLSRKIHLAADGHARPLLWPSRRARLVTRLPSRRSWPASGCREPDLAGLAPTPSWPWPTVPPHPRQSAAICAVSRSARSSRSRRTRSATVCGPPAKAGVAARLRRGCLQAAPHHRTVHQPPQAVAQPGHTNRQTRLRLPGRTPPRRHPHVDTTLTKETEPTAVTAKVHRVGHADRLGRLSEQPARRFVRQAISDAAVPRLGTEVQPQAGTRSAPWCDLDDPT